jgi:hypothetical protein
LLVISVPYVSWTDLQANDLPTLRRFVATAGVANLATRIGQHHATLDEAYVTMGAGTRATRAQAGDAFDVGERYGSATAGTVYARRTGHPAVGAIVVLDAPRVEALNKRSPYGASAGSVGSALAAAKVTRAVVGNDDLAEDTPISARFDRPAAAALMGTAGQLPAGDVGNDLLAAHDQAAFGTALDEPAVLAAFSRSWDGPGRRVVLVEASDLVRADAYRAVTTTASAAAAQREALAMTDHLVASLLARVDLRRDSVLVVAPVPNRSTPDLSVVALHAPGLGAGLLRSPSTRRSGFVQLADVGASMLSLVGVSVPTQFEGRPMSVGASGGSAADRISYLVDTAHGARVRDATVSWATWTLIVFVVALGIAFGLRPLLPRWARGVLGGVAVAVLAVIPATYLAALVPDVANLPALGVAVLIPAVVLAVVLELVRRRRALDAALTALAVITLLFVVDLVAGAHLQLNTVFGYSPTVAGRFSGIGNLAFAFLASAALLLAVLVTERLPGRRGLWIAVAVFVTAVLVDGLPMLGADVGGVIAMVPAFGITGMLLAGRRVRARHVVGWIGVTLVVVAGFALIDLARPADERTHLAHFVERSHSGRHDPAFRLISRRLAATVGSPQTATWVLLLLIAVLAAHYFFVRRERAPLASRLSLPARAALSGLLVLAALGLLANDSGFAVPGVMLAVAVPITVLRYDAWLTPSRLDAAR